MLWHQNSGAKPLPLNSGAMAFLVPNSILLTWHHFWSLAPKVWHHDSLCSNSSGVSLYALGLEKLPKGLTWAVQKEDEKSLKVKRVQEAARKDIERAFGVLQGRWGIIRQPAASNANQHPQDKHVM
ncbi:ALP1-like protein isoform X1 [Tanacetum coccineum]